LTTTTVEERRAVILDCITNELAGLEASQARLGDPTDPGETYFDTYARIIDLAQLATDLDLGRWQTLEAETVAGPFATERGMRALRRSAEDLLSLVGDGEDSTLCSPELTDSIERVVEDLESWEPVA